jgi:hypothetical protein
MFLFLGGRLRCYHKLGIFVPSIKGEVLCQSFTLLAYNDSGPLRLIIIYCTPMDKRCSASSET